MTTYYASNAGGASGLSQGSPFQIANFWGVAAPGDTLYLLDGTYQGANSMITPTSGLNGTSGAPITISALNDGAVLIDGQDVRIPVSLTNCDYWIIQGINAGNSSAEVVQVRSGSNHNIFRRVIAFDALVSANSHVWSFDASSFNLAEDCASFGTGRKQFELFGGSDNNVLRRCFSIWQGSTSESGPIYNFAIGYDSKNNIAENCIGTRDEQVVPSGGYFGLDAIFTTGDRLTAAPCTNNNAFYGCIGFIRSAQTYNNGSNGMAFAPGYDFGTFKDVALYLEAHPSAIALLAQAYTQAFGGCNPNASGGNMKLTNFTEIGFSVASSIATGSNGWTQTNYKTASTVAGVYGSESLFVNNGAKGATVRYRYVDGVLTSTPVFPWPMNSRIIAAMNAAGYTAIDIDATLQSIFGAYQDASVPTVPAFTTYYVSKTGSDSNSGLSLALAKLTIGAALALMSARDHLVIGPGVYTEGLRDVIPGGSSSLPTTIQALQPNSVTLRPTGGTDVIRLNADYITIDGIDADAVNCSGAPYEMGNSGNGVSNVIIKNGRARNGSGVTVDGSAVQFFNMLVYGNAAGLRVQGGIANLVFSNTVYGNAGTYGIWISAGTGHRIQNNIVHGNTSDTVLDQGTASVVDHNLTTDPLFVDAATGDFRLRPGSLAIDAGINLAAYSTTDFYGNTRT